MSRLCKQCGNTIESDEECRVCAAGRGFQRKPPTPEPAKRRTTICSVCGNEIVPGESCAVCAAGRGFQKKVERKEALCPTCGNVVANVQECPVCLSGRAPQRARRREEAKGPACPRCREALEEQQWEEVLVLMCPTCQGALFPVGGLEGTLDKLRQGVESASLADVLNEFRTRAGGVMPAAVRYKSCPRCRGTMTRRNYAGVSGVIVDFCGRDGTWVDQAAFSQLAEFITKGGDLLAARSPLNRRKGV